MHNIAVTQYTKYLNMYIVSTFKFMIKMIKIRFEYRVMHIKKAVLVQFSAMLQTELFDLWPVI